jgi:hypothetical protein
VRYRHTQIGWTMIVTLGGGSAFLAWAAAKRGGFAPVVVLAVAALLLVLLVLFVSLTVTVDDERVELRMGPGPIRRCIPVSEVLSVDRLTLPWWAVGYGIRMSLNGKRQLWRVSGSNAVNLELSGDRRLLITSDEPDALTAVISAAIEATR